MELKDDKKTNIRYLNEFHEAIDDDLDMPKALAVLWRLVRDEKADGKIGAIREMDKVFGLDLLLKERIEIPLNVRELIDKREKARGEKNWKKADSLREEIKKLGFKVDDAKGGVKISKI